MSRLASDRVGAGQEYERLRQKLCRFFDWRGSLCPDAHADEALDRVARRLDEGEPVEALGPYAYGVARRVLFEWERSRVREEAARKEARANLAAASPDPVRERRLACLEHCLSELPEEGRTLIQAYYAATKTGDLDSRKQLAQRLGVSYGTLKTRAHRVRARLETCLHECLGRESGAAVHIIVPMASGQIVVVEEVGTPPPTMAPPSSA